MGGRSHSYSCGTDFQLLHLLEGPPSQCGYSTYTWQERFPASWLEHLTTQTLLAAVTHTKYLGHQPVPTCLPISQFKRGYRQKGCGVKELLACGRGMGTGWGKHINSPFCFLCQMLWSISFNKHSKRQSPNNRHLWFLSFYGRKSIIWNVPISGVHVGCNTCASRNFQPKFQARGKKDLTICK